MTVLSVEVYGARDGFKILRYAKLILRTNDSTFIFNEGFLQDKIRIEDWLIEHI
jgi:hypothetical protein